MPAPSLRENTAGTIVHPEFLMIGSDQIALVEDPLCDPLFKGDGVLGWEGDRRLALYFSAERRRWVLMRFERDGIYRLVFVMDADVTRSADVAGKMIIRLLAHDTRRGFDLDRAVAEQNARVEAEHERQRQEFTGEFADRLKHALIKDGVD